MVLGWERGEQRREVCLAVKLPARCTADPGLLSSDKIITIFIFRLSGKTACTRDLHGNTGMFIDKGY